MTVAMSIAAGGASASGAWSAVLDEVPESSPRATSPTRDLRLRYLVEAYFQFIWRCLRGLGVPAASADDATQHVFWIASQKLDAIAVGSEKAFLFSTARGVAANTRRALARKRECADEVALATRADDRPDPEEIASANQARRFLEVALSEMPDDLRTVFILFELEGLTTAAIARMIEIPMGTVASRLSRARQSFHETCERFQREGGRRG